MHGGNLEANFPSLYQISHAEGPRDSSPKGHPRAGGVQDPHNTGIRKMNTVKWGNFRLNIAFFWGFFSDISANFQFIEKLKMAFVHLVILYRMASLVFF